MNKSARRRRNSAGPSRSVSDRAHPKTGRWLLLGVVGLVAIVGIWLGELFSRQRAGPETTDQTLKVAERPALENPEPEMLGVHYRLARALVGMGQLNEAVDVLRKDIEISPTACNSHCLLGQIYLQLKDLEKAKASYEEAVRLRDGLSDAYYGLAKVCARLKQRDESRQYMEKFTQLKARDSKADRRR